ncbi:MAG: hypothetical protein RKE49_06650 [Oceanicaulis sp.]
MGAFLSWLGSAFLDHAAGSFRALGLAFFISAFLAGDRPSFGLALIGLIFLLSSPFLARTAAVIEGKEEAETDGI